MNENHVEYSRFTIGNFSIQEHVTTGNFIIYIVELILCFIACPLNIMFIAVLANTSTLHFNLRILLISTCVSDAIFAISRYMILIPLLVAYLFNTEISSITYCWFAKSLHHVVMAAPGVTLFVLIVERSLASYLYKTYESQSCYQSGLILTGLQYTYSLAVTIINQIDVAGTPRPYSRLPCQIEYSTGRCVFLVVVISIFFNTTAVIMFFKVIKFNKTLFRQRSWKLRSLTETYQISENLKSIRLLYPILIIMLASNILSILLVSLNAIIYLAVRETPENERISIMTKLVGRGNEIAQSFDVTAILSKIAFCYAIRRHPTLFKNWQIMFLRVKIRPGNMDKTDLTGLDGKKFTFTTIEETQRHFDSLSEWWK